MKRVPVENARNIYDHGKELVLEVNDAFDRISLTDEAISIAGCPKIDLPALGLPSDTLAQLESRRIQAHLDFMSFSETFGVLIGIQAFLRLESSLEVEEKE